MAAAGFISLSEWSFTICPTPYNRKYNVLSASLNKLFPSFHSYGVNRFHITKHIYSHSNTPSSNTYAACIGQRQLGLEVLGSHLGTCSIPNGTDLKQIRLQTF